MKVISMWEPWATLYVLGLKRIETRGWPTTHQGWTAVHATKGGLSLSDLLSQCFKPHFYEALQEFPPFREQIEAATRRVSWIGRVFHHGCIIGAVNIIACHPTQRRSWQAGIFEFFPELDTPRERAFGNYEPGRYGILAQAKTLVLSRPIPFRSRQGKLLDLPEELVAEMRRQELPEAHR